MNNIVNFNSAPDLGGFGAADFDTVSIPTMINFNGRSIATGKHAIVRTDTGAILGHHGSRYGKVCQKDALNTAEDMFGESDLKSHNMVRTISCSHNGANTFAKYTFPSHMFKSPDGDSSILEALVTTSFNSTFPFLIAFGERLGACNNSNIYLTGAVAMFKAKHTKGLNIKRGAEAVGNALKQAQDNHVLFQKMYNTPVDDMKAFKVYAEASGVTNQVNEIESEYLKRRNYIAPNWRHILSELPRQNQNLNYMIEHSKEYGARMGKNQWAVYNTLTDWSSHAPATTAKSESNYSMVSAKRGQVVRRVVNEMLLAA